jgi:hypothetical protein
MGFGSLMVVDASDPSQPSQIAATASAYGMFDVAIEGGYVYLACNDDGLYIFRFNPLIHEVFLPVVGR